MNQYLPYLPYQYLLNKLIQWLNKKEINRFWMRFLEVDLEYPDELHELHNDYPYK